MLPAWVSLQASLRALSLFLTVALAKTSPLWDLSLCSVKWPQSIPPYGAGWSRGECWGALGPPGPVTPQRVALPHPTLLFSPLPRLLGVDKVLGYALNEWLQDIRKNQLPGLLGGVGPMHSVVQLCEYLTLGALENAILLGSLEAATGNRWKSSHSRVGGGSLGHL